jgi:hypothetical protein
VPPFSTRSVEQTNTRNIQPNTGGRPPAFVLRRRRIPPVKGGGSQGEAPRGAVRDIEDMSVYVTRICDLCLKGEVCPKMRKELSHAWGVFLSRFPWDWFVTLTFRAQQPSFRAYHLFRRFANDLQRASRFRVAWFMVFEYGHRTGRLHIHALMLNVAHLGRLSWMEEWNQRAGYARILPFNRDEGAAFYCAKYVTKSGSEWEIVGLPTAVQQVLLLAGDSRTVVRRSGSEIRGTQPSEEPQLRYAITKLHTSRRDWESDMLLTARRWGADGSR